MTFEQKLKAIVSKNDSLACVGLDPDFEKLPSSFQSQKYPQFAFNKFIIDCTHTFVAVYKPNSAFYEARGIEGISELKMTCDYVHEAYPDIPIILDAKRADIGSTNTGYVQYAFDWLGVDAITLQPYLGAEALKPFLDRKDKGCIILCRTSNPGAGEFQDLVLYSDSGNQNIKLYQKMAEQVATKWNTNGNCMLVVGATYPEELAEVRRLAGDMWFLVPGIGTQGGDVEKTVKAGLNSKGTGMIINSSRGIIFAKDPGEEARKLRDEINRYR